MPDIDFECPMCKQPLAAPDELANQLIECPTCTQTIEVPLRPRPPQIPPQSAPTPPPALSCTAQRSQRHGFLYYASWGIVSLIGVLATLFFGLTALKARLGVLTKSTPEVTAPASKKSDAKGAHLRVGNWNWQKTSPSHVTAEGEVTNISSESLQNVQAVVTFRTQSGDFITSDSAMIAYNPILPGQTSPWQVIGTWNPAMDSASVQFKTLFGPTLLVEKQHERTAVPPE